MHFLGTVIGPETESEVDDALARWDENKDVEPYVVEYREDLLERAREWASRRPDVDGSDEDALLRRFALYTGAELDEDGNEVSTMPEDAFYDWYELGGRWSGETASLQGLTVDGLRACAEAYPAVVALLGGIAVSVHGDGYEEEPTDPLAGCAGGRKGLVRGLPRLTWAHRGFLRKGRSLPWNLQASPTSRPEHRPTAVLRTAVASPSTKPPTTRRSVLR